MLLTYLNYLLSTLKHKRYFLLAGLRVGGIPFWRLLTHDLSKFSPGEFFRYARWYMGKGRDKSAWAFAWRHHYHNNKHHPEHWVMVWRGELDFYAGMGERIADHVVVFPMPEIHIREMAADMMAASMTYTNSWDMTDWLAENLPKTILHSETRKRFMEIVND